MEVNKKRLLLAKERQKELILNETSSEKYFKRFLREYDYESQVIIFTSSYYFYIVDFYIPKYKLVIEIDGPSHELSRNYDEIRTNNLKSAGIRKVLRFTNEEVYTMDENKIKQLIKISLLA